MSNDQSPPARKIIPYKKGGPRRSPFADMALQFSGTALDVAIQQREEASEDNAPEVSEAQAPEPPADGPESGTPLTPEPEPTQSVKDMAPEPPLIPPVVTPQEPAPSPRPVSMPQTRRRRPPAREVRLVTDKGSAPTALGATDSQLLAFITRWKPFLTETQLGICTYIYNNSAMLGQEYCFTSTAKLMAAVSKTERQVKTVINQLTDWGFLIKGETVVNAPRELRGTYYKLAVTKS